MQLWNVVTGRLKATLVGHSGGVNSVAFSPDGSTLASTGFDSTVRLWDIATGRPKATLAGHSGGVSSVAFSPDGNILAGAGSSYEGSDDDTVRLWDVATRAAAGHICG